MGPCQGCAASRCGLGPLGGPIAVILDITYNISQNQPKRQSPLPAGGRFRPNPSPGGVVDVVTHGKAALYNYGTITEISGAEGFPRARNRA